MWSDVIPWLEFLDVHGHIGEEEEGGGRGTKPERLAELLAELAEVSGGSEVSVNLKKKVKNTIFVI